MDTLSDNEIRLLVFDHLQPRAQIPNLLLDRRNLLVLVDVQHAMDVEAGWSVRLFDFLVRQGMPRVIDRSGGMFCAKPPT